MEDLISRAVEFHGHLGPFLVLGLRMGLMARRMLGFAGHFDVKVNAFTGTRTPVSCIVDGLQVSTGATLGKGNIHISPPGAGLPRATFEAGGKTVEIALTPRALELTKDLEGREATAAAAQKVLDVTEDELFVATEGG